MIIGITTTIMIMILVVGMILIIKIILLLILIIMTIMIMIVQKQTNSENGTQFGSIHNYSKPINYSIKTKSQKFVAIFLS